jgi:hypothetical protein
MPNKSPGKKELKKPKKDAKVNAVMKEAPVPVSVEVVKKKKKERVEDES